MSFKRKMKGEPAFPIFLGGVRISAETAAKIAAGMEREKKARGVFMREVIRRGLASIEAEGFLVVRGATPTTVERSGDETRK